MAINVNEVYQTVLFILNKEQRGYVTPAEFNKLATQAQLDIFEKYFEDLNQQLRIPENDSEYGNRVKTIQEKIAIFEVNENLTGGSPYDLTALTHALHRLGTVEYTAAGSLPVELQETTQHDYNLSSRSKLTAPTTTWPIFTFRDLGQITTSPDLDPITIFYIKKPTNPIWGYDVGGVGEFVYNEDEYHETTQPTGSINFEISSIDQTELILTILMYAGVIIRDQSIIQAAAGKIAQDNQNEKS